VGEEKKIVTNDTKGGLPRCPEEEECLSDIRPRAYRRKGRLVGKETKYGEKQKTEKAKNTHKSRHVK